MRVAERYTDMAQPERIAHINTVNWFKYHYPDLEDDLHHFANERIFEKKGGAEYYAGNLLKRMGVKKGVADFFLAIPCNGKAGLWIELKVDNNKLSQHQKDFLDRKASRGYAAVCVRGSEAARDVISDYLKDYVPQRT